MTTHRALLTLWCLLALAACGRPVPPASPPGQPPSADATVPDQARIAKLLERAQAGDLPSAALLIDLQCEGELAAIDLGTAPVAAWSASSTSCGGKTAPQILAYLRLLRAAPFDEGPALDPELQRSRAALAASDVSDPFLLHAAARAYVYLAPTDPAAADGLYRRVIAAVEQEADVPGWLHGRHLHAEAASLNPYALPLGRWDDVRAKVVRARAIATEAGDTVGLAMNEYIEGLTCVPAKNPKGTWAEAILHFQRAAAIAGPVDAKRSADAQLLVGLSFERSWNPHGDWQRAKAAFARSRDGYRATASARGESRLLGAMVQEALLESRAEHRWIDPAEALEALRALAAAHPEFPALAWRRDHYAGLVAVSPANPRQDAALGMTLLGQALGTARSAQLLEPTADSAEQLADACLALADKPIQPVDPYALAEQLTREALAIREQLHAVHSCASDHLRLVHVVWPRRGGPADWQPVRAESRLARDLFAQCGLGREQGYALTTLAEALFQLGSGDEARSANDEAVRLLEDAGESEMAKRVRDRGTRYLTAESL
jgi:hypothetical protein